MQDISWRVQSTYYPSFIQVSTAKRHRARNCTVSHFPEGEGRGGGGGIGGRIGRPVGVAAAIAFRPKVRPCLGLLGLPPGTDPWIHRSIQIPRNASQMNLQIHPHGKAAQMNKWNKVLSETPHHCGGAKWHDRLSKAPLTKRHKGNLCPWHKYKDFSDFPVL